MSWLNPFGLLWLASIPVLVWLWRLSATRRQTRIPSLVPFEHLLPKTALRRSRVIVNALFWLQLAALAALAAALAQPVWMRKSVEPVLIVLDTSASQQARRSDGTRAFDASKRAAIEQLDSIPGGSLVLVMGSAPVAPLTPEPTADRVAARQAIERAVAADISGDLTAAATIGAALLGAVPSRTFIVTDEPQPDAVQDDRMIFRALDVRAPNVALVGLESQASLCAGLPAAAVAAVQNFGDRPQNVQLSVQQPGHPSHQQQITLAAGQRLSVPLPIEDGFDGAVEVKLLGEADALALDNSGRLDATRTETLPVRVVSENPAFVSAVGRWLDACDGLPRLGLEEHETPHVLITDSDDTLPGAAVGIMRFPDGRNAKLVRSAYWLPNDAHEAGEYLAAIEPVNVRVAEPLGVEDEGEPVIVGIVDGRRVPLVVSRTQEGIRRIIWRIDPTSGADSPSLLIAFFNGLRWTMGRADMRHAGDPIEIAGLSAGEVAVRRPDGRMDRFPHRGGLFRYTATEQEGRYVIQSREDRQEIWLTFLNPLESDLTHRVSTWRPFLPGSGSDAEVPPAPEPLHRWVLFAALVVLLGEWGLYVHRFRRREAAKITIEAGGGVL